jgi:hypothetical protein
MKGATLLSTNRRDLTPEEKAGLSPETILREIRGAQKEKNLAFEDIKDWAAVAFADLNGWRWDPNAWFMPEDLGKRGNSYRHIGMPYSWGDHPLFFRAPRMGANKRGSVNTCIVGQPYYLDERELEHLRRDGYGVSLPPVPRASFHLPGACFFVAVTQTPLTVVHFLPEQHSREALAPWLPPGA